MVRVLRSMSFFCVLTLSICRFSSIGESDVLIIPFGEDQLGSCHWYVGSWMNSAAPPSGEMPAICFFTNAFEDKNPRRIEPRDLISFLISFFIFFCFVNVYVKHKATHLSSSVLRIWPNYCCTHSYTELWTDDRSEYIYMLRTPDWFVSVFAEVLQDALFLEFAACFLAECMEYVFRFVGCKNPWFAIFHSG